MRSVVDHHLVNDVYLNFYVVPCSVVQDIKQLKYRFFVGHITLVFTIFDLCLCVL